MDNIDREMEQYFAQFRSQDNIVETKASDRSRMVTKPNKPTLHSKETNRDINGYEQLAPRTYADGNISDVEEFANLLKKLCNAAWGSDWGELSPDIKRGEKSDEVILPQITVDINTREITEGMPVKPVLVDIVNETDEEGNETGDALLVYRQWFDCNVEFNIYGRNSKDARDLMNRFERLITVYSGYLKRKGVSEIIFLQEVSPKSSLNYAENVTMRSIYYYIRLECITLVKQSRINAINAEIGIGPMQNEKLRTLLNTNKTINGEDLFDLSFFDGDNGITIKDL